MTTEACKVSVCSPVHNEDDNIRELIERVGAIMRKAYGDCWEQLLVDDGSTDRSASLIKQLQSQHPNVVLVRHEQNQGERAAWSTALATARGEVVVIMASDLQSQPEDVPRLIDLVLNRGFDVGTGARQRRKDGAYYWCATRVLNLFMCVAFGLSVRDVSSSVFAARANLVRDLKLMENDHRYILAIIKRRGATIEEIEVAHQLRQAGHSHYSRWKVLAAIPEVVRFQLRFVNSFYDLAPQPVRANQLEKAHV